jgi:hypothetical protein
VPLGVAIQNEFSRHLVNDRTVTIHLLPADHGVGSSTYSRSGVQWRGPIAPQFGRACGSIRPASLFDFRAIKATGFEDALESSKMPSDLRRCPENCASKSAGIFERAHGGLITSSVIEP